MRRDTPPTPVAKGQECPDRCALVEADKGDDFVFVSDSPLREQMHKANKMLKESQIMLNPEEPTSSRLALPDINMSSDESMSEEDELDRFDSNPNVNIYISPPTSSSDDDEPSDPKFRVPIQKMIPRSISPRHQCQSPLSPSPLQLNPGQGRSPPPFALPRSISRSLSSTSDYRVSDHGNYVARLNHAACVERFLREELARKDELIKLLEHRVTSLMQQGKQARAEEQAARARSGPTGRRKCPLLRWLENRRQKKRLARQAAVALR